MKLINCISYLMLLIAGLTIATVLFWLIYPYKPLTIHGDVFIIQNKDKTIKQGDVLYFTSDNCKHVDMPSTTSRAFVNHIIYYVPLQITNVRKGCGKVTISVPISKELPTGEYYLQNIFQYQVNPIRTITIEHNTEKFKIIE